MSKRVLGALLFICVLGAIIAGEKIAATTQAKTLEREYAVGTWVSSDPAPESCRMVLAQNGTGMYAYQIMDEPPELYRIEKWEYRQEKLTIVARRACGEDHPHTIRLKAVLKTSHKLAFSFDESAPELTMELIREDFLIRKMETLKSALDKCALDKSCGENARGNRANRKDVLGTKRASTQGGL